MKVAGERNDLSPEEVLRELGREARRRRASELSEEEVERAAEAAWEGYGEEAFGEGFRSRVAARLRSRRSPRRRIPQRGLLVAASLFLVVLAGAGALRWLRQEGSDGPLPAYSLVALGSEARRSEAEGPGAPHRDALEVVPGLRFSVRLRPSQRPEGEVAAGVFAGASDGSPTPWPEAQSKLEVSAAGVVRLEGLAEEDWRRLGPGRWILFFTVGRRGSLPSATELQAVLDRGAAPRSRDWQLLTQEIHLAPPP